MFLSRCDIYVCVRERDDGQVAHTGKEGWGWQRTSARNFSAFRLCCFVLRFNTGFVAECIPSIPAASGSPCFVWSRLEFWSVTELGLSKSMPCTPPWPLLPSACRAPRMRTLVASSASASCARRSSASCAARRSAVCSASGGLYDVPGCGEGTAANAIVARGLGTSGAYI
jgi:hypothetical protein